MIISFWEYETKEELVKSFCSIIPLASIFLKVWDILNLNFSVW